MPIFVSPAGDLKVLFVHIPKCGGGSVEQFLRSYGFRQGMFSIDPAYNSVLKCSPQHMHAELLLGILRVDRFDCVFSIVRDPVERMLSEYRWRIKHPWARDGFDKWYSRS